MFIPGLVSITFRKLAPAEVVSLVRKAGLACIEWGGDVHVPHGDLARAAEVRKQTVDAGLQTAAYGSYYRAGSGQPPAFDAVLETAVALGAPVIRVWAGVKGSAESTSADRAAVAADLRRIGMQAQAAGVRVALEWHGNTLTDTLDSSLRLLDDTGLPPAALGCYWQPHVGMAPAACRAELPRILPRLAHLHVFQWRVHDRLPLADGAAVWPDYFREAAASGRDHAAMLEFVRNDSSDQFLADARALLDMLRGVSA